MMDKDKKIKWHQPDLNEEDMQYVTDAFNSSWISNGPYVTEFEEKIRMFTGAKHAIAVCNGTAALHLALWGVDVMPGDDVIVPAFTFVAPASIAQLLGAHVVSADICLKSWCIDPKSVRAHITSKTKAIVAVHTYGNIANMSELLEISKETGIPIIEDSAESFGSTYEGKQSGSMGLVGTYSFHATKNITTGEGGMVLTSNTDLYEKMLAFREHGMKKRKTYWHDCAGHNFRLTNLQAALGCSQLNRLEEILHKKNHLEGIYRKLFEQDKRFILQTIDRSVSMALWAFAVLIDFSNLNDHDAKIKRDSIIEKMSGDGIEMRPGFIPLSDLPPFEKNVSHHRVASYVSSRVIVMPSHTGITEEMAAYIYDRLSFYLERECNV